MHLKVIYKIDLYASHNPINKNNTGSSKKVKEGKGNVKSLYSGLIFYDLFSVNPELKPGNCKIRLFFRHIVIPEYQKINNLLIPRAPPLV